MTGSAKRPRIAVIGCGGTISTIAADVLDFIDYPETGRKMQITEVFERFGELADFVDIEPVAFRAVGSSAMGPAEWVELARMIMRFAHERKDLSGVVIVHGTATLEETAYFLNLTLKTELPVVLVGAQRPANALGTDAGINLHSALRVAVDPHARARGVLVVLNDEIHAARDVTKSSTYRVQAFQSPELGPLGMVDADRVTFYRQVVRAHTTATPFEPPEHHDRLPRVDIAYAYGGADGAAVEAFVRAGARGIVSAGFAPGMPSPAERGALEAAARNGVVVVQSSRVGTGRVARRLYLREHGWLGADNLTPQKARILLMLSLTRSDEAEFIQDCFDRF